MTRKKGKSTKSEEQRVARERVARLKRAERLFSKGLGLVVDASMVMHGNPPAGFVVGSGAWRQLPLFGEAYLRMFRTRVDAILPCRDDLRSELEHAREALREA